MLLSPLFVPLNTDSNPKKKAGAPFCDAPAFLALIVFFVWRISAFKRIQAHAVLTALRRLLHAAP